MIKIIFVSGTRPNFVKIAPLIRAVRALKNIDWRFVHTGQHYSHRMSEVFFKDLALPLPSTNLNVGSGSHANQVASVMTAFESYCLQEKPDIVFVVGDVNSTLGAALAVSKLDGIKLAHVEAGCRHFDHSPEEINRVLVDRISDYLFCPTTLDRSNALAEGIPSHSCYVVGDIAVDTLLSVLPKIKTAAAPQRYAIFTIHRPANVDNTKTLKHLLTIAKEISKQIRIIFPIHPRTLNTIETSGLNTFANHLDFYPALGYIECMSLLKGAQFLLTDSGGLQVEAHFLKTPCLTLDTITGHMATVSCRANTLVGTDPHAVLSAARGILNDPHHHIIDGDFWDGHVAETIINLILGRKNRTLPSLPGLPG